MFGVWLMLLLAVIGGIIAYIADKLGSKIGKKRMTVFGLRPHNTSVLLTVLSGVLIALCSIGILAVASRDARTALFGMEKLQKELQTLNKEKASAGVEYAKAMDLLKQKNQEVMDLDSRIQTVNADKETAERNLQTAVQQYEQTQGALVAARSEVQNLTEAKETLNQEIVKLEEQTEALKKGLVVQRQGQLLFRSGEVVFAGVVKGGLSAEENRKQVNWVLQGANRAALARLGLKEDSGTEIIWTPKQEYLNLLTALDKNEGSILVRVRSTSNTVAGQPVVCQLEILPNKLIYKGGQEIYRKVINLNNKEATLDEALLTYLQEINKLTVEAGVLPDPLTGNVGNMNPISMVETARKMQRLGGQVLLTAYADGDISSAGPVQLRLEVERVAGLP